MVAVAEAEHTAATLAAAGVRIALVTAGLTATRVDVSAPPALAPVVRAALAWRIEAMRAQLRGLGGPTRTPVAVPNSRPRMAPAVTWRGPVEYSGRVVWQTRTAQRPEAGWCASCDEPHATTGETGDCVLCNAARVAALRAEGVIPAATALPPVPAPMTLEQWRDRDASGLRALPPVPPRLPWTCERCGFENVGRRREVEGCGPCVNREDATLDMSRLAEGRAA